MPTDLFGRTTSFGLGTDGTFTYVWSERDTGYGAAADSLFLVDGSQLVIPGTGGNDWDSYIVDAPTPAKAGKASYDIFFPTLASSDQNTDFLAPMFLYLEWADIIAFGSYPSVILGFEQDFDYDNDDPHVLFGPYAGSFVRDWLDVVHPLSVPIELGEWYTAKVEYNIDQRLMGYKLWKRSDPEPDEYLLLLETSDDFGWIDGPWDDGYDGKPWIEMYYTGTEDEYIDNLVFDSTAPTELYRPRRGNAFVMSGQIQTWVDPFDSDTTVGPGPGYEFVPYDGSHTYATSTSGVDAEDALTKVISGTLRTSPATPAQQFAYDLVGSNRLMVGYIQIDFKIPTTWTAGRAPLKLVVGRNDYRFGFHLQSSTTSPARYQINISSFLGPSGGFLFAVTVGNWYTAKLLYDGNTGEEQIIVKAQGAADTSAIVSYSLFTSPVSDGGTGEVDRLIFGTPAAGQPVFDFDNLQWLGQAGFWGDALFVAAAGGGAGSITARAVIKRTQTGSMTADARFLQAFHSITGNSVLKRNQTHSLLADALVGALHFFGDAWITDNGLLRHFRDRDHDGELLDTSVVLDADVGSYQAGTTLRELLLDLWAQIERSR